MLNKEKRRCPRIDSINLIAYACIDENETTISQGMGRTLNVSETGILLETHYPMDCEDVMLIGVGIKDDLIDIRGRVVHAKVNSEGKHESGIEFISIDNRSSDILKKYIKAFSEHRT